MELYHNELWFRMTWFREFRGNYGFAYYGELRTAVTVDVSLVAVVYSCILISIATLIATAGIRGKERWYTFLRVIYSLAVGSTILLCIFGYCWQIGKSALTGPYIYRSGEQIEGDIGMTIALRKVNITLTGSFQGSNGEVSYNEEIHLEGISAPRTELRKYLMRGLPDPVISIVEYLSIDVGGLRWGRGFSTAGYFANILLWASFSFWIVANIMLGSVVFYGAALFTLTGVTMVLAAITYHVLQPTLQPRILCTNQEFQIKYSSCFWATLFVGIITIILGLAILISDYKLPKKMAKFFLIDSPIEEEECYDMPQIKKSSSVPCYPRKMDVKRHCSAPNIWNINKGYVDYGDTNIPNPVYEESEEEKDNTVDSTNYRKTNNNLTNSSESLRASTNNLKTSFQIGDDDVVVKSQGQNSLNKDDGRLKEIYVDIDPSKTQVMHTA